MHDSNAMLPDNPLIFVDGNELTTIDITIQDVIDQVKCLDCSKSFGPDGISPVFITEGADIIATILHRLFRLLIWQKFQNL